MAHDHTHEHKQTNNIINPTTFTNVKLTISAITLILSLIIKPQTLHGIDLSWIAIILCGLPIIIAGFTNAIKEHEIKEGLLVAVAMTAAIATKEYFAAAEIAILMELGETLEERTIAKARKGIEKLIKLSPQTAIRIENSTAKIIPVEQIQINDTLRVLAGETIPVDGIITKGNTSIDQSILTGEPIPQDKNVGDEIYSGTINKFGTFEMKASKTAENSSMARMIKLVESADSNKTKISKLADKIATWVVITAFTTSIGTWFYTGEILRAVTILVVFCPCALILATPTAIMAAIGNVTKSAYLVKEGDALEKLATVDTIVMDKTGTITTANLKVEKITTTDTSDETELYQKLATAELLSEHPLGKAIIQSYKSTHNTEITEPENFKLIPGRGIIATVNGEQITAGNKQLLHENGIETKETEESEQQKAQGKTIIWIATNGTQSGYITLSDTIKENAKETIKELKTQGIKTIILTGDNETAAKHIAQQTGIDSYKADCTPEEKLNAIRELQKQNHIVCMIGDGINDAAALKTSNVGIAMAKIGSDIAIEAADIAQINDEIKDLPHLIAISRKMMGTIKLNIILSLTLNFIAIGLAMTGKLSPLMGALVHNVSSIAVVINSTLLLNYKRRV
ncbi:MAG: cation-translocating P-type ATPase [Synergistaceae bacterium]